MKQNYFLGQLRSPRQLATGWLLLLLVVLAAPRALRAQTYQLPQVGSTTITTCSGTLYDNGGPNGPYSANADGITTIMPGTAGSKVRLQFNNVVVESYYDHLYVYDGTSTAAPLIGSYDSYSQPGTLYGTTASGALTVRLTSDGVAQYDGFAATIGCVTTIPPQAQADLTVQSAQLSLTSVLAGNATYASGSVYNLSGATASSSSMGYYLSTNQTLDASDVQLGNTYGYAISVGQSSSHYTNLTIPVGTAAGSYYVLFVADYLNQVSESNETNNVSAVSFTVAAPSIDLVIQQPSISPTNPAPGTALNMSCYISNQGNAVAPSSSVGFYLSNDATLDAADQLLTSQYGAQLYVSYPSQRYGTAAVPSGLAPGTYYILFVADYQNQVPESNEANNVMAVSFTVNPPGIDLVIQQEQLYPTSTVAGNSVQASCTILNQGNVTAASSTVGFYLSTNTSFDASDVLLSTTTGFSLPAYQYSSRYVNPVIPVGTAPGNYYVLFVADPANAVAEVNETNNVRSLALTVMAATIDLTNTSVYLSPTSVPAGGSTQASSSLYNQGNSLASPATLGYYLSTNQTLDASDVLLTSNTGTVYGGSYTTRYATLTVPTGTALGNYYVLFVADHLNQLVETNETNNVTAMPLQVVAPSIDLLITQPYLSPSVSVPNSTINISCAINNQGNSVASSSNIGYYLSTNTVLDASDVLLLNSPGGAIGAGGYLSRYNTLTIPAGTALGNYFVLFVADPTNVVAESNETNNVASAALQIVAPVVDLITSQPYVSPNVSAPLGIVSASGYVQNLGNSTASSSNIGYYLSTNAVLDASDVLLLNSPGAALGAGGYQSRYNNLTIPAGTAVGSYYILFVADPTNAVAESNEANNVSSYPLQIVAPVVDLITSQPYVSPSVSAAGNSVGVSCYIQNLGNSTASSSDIGYYLSTNQTFDASDVLLLNSPGVALAGGGYLSRYNNLTIPAGTAAGNYYILFVADPTNTVAESNETNNVSSTPLLLLAPGVDLIPQQPQLFATNATPGFGIQASCAILNSGTTTAPSSTLGFYLSSDQTLDASDVLLTTVVGGALGSGQMASRTGTLVVPTGTAAGSYYVLFVADPTNAVAETNETNNVISQPLTVNPPFSGNVVPLSGVATVTSCSTSVYDNGGLSNYADNSSGMLTLLPATTGAMVQLAFTAFDTESGYDFVSIYDGTNANAPLLATYSGYYQTSQLPLPLTATNAAGALTVVFSSDGYVNAAGFVATVSCVSAPQPDLLLTQIGASPSTVPAGNNVSLTATVANQGGGAASASAVGFYLSTDQVLSANDVLLGTSPGGALGLNLTANRLLTARVPANTTPGSYFVLFMADPANAVAETNEANNMASLRLTVTQATATRDETAGYTIAVAPNPVANGQPLLVRLNGSGPSGPATLELYNALGQRVQAQALVLSAGRANRTEVATQGLASGVYTLRLTGSGLSVTRRVLIN
ncbi:T9SS type A sorting domain-containing protein [Hymenobacter sp. DH14]|uniref:T9SS type A sorting domain-containing protein n=1 Tax=Hymenobacter cyanobacteriorum TaxID=2926463 RepID=A0A9X1VJZ8_9BACT|nr:CARDB domain-containing protein [Hymenobacter cyanobacteriorum]MCI1189603.1 T9SS type A sorting domain-containing protein [Hymenobacter cyanobacteriorum]